MSFDASRAGWARARLDTRRPGVPPVAAGLLALDARRAAPAVHRERELAVGRVVPAAGTATCLAMLLGTYTEIAFRRVTARSRAPSGCSTAPELLSTGGSSSLREPLPGSLTANFHVVADRRRDGLFRRNALGTYGVYGAAIVSGLVVTPIMLHALGDDAFGIWAFIGAITIYLSVLDLGVGPSIVRFAAEARGRGQPEDTNALASAGLALYGVIGAATLPLGAALAWLVPLLIDTPDDLVWDGPHRDVLRRRSRSRRGFRSGSSTTCSSGSSASTSRTSPTSSGRCSTPSSSRSCPGRGTRPARRADVRGHLCGWACRSRGYVVSSRSCGFVVRSSRASACGSWPRSAGATSSSTWRARSSSPRTSSSSGSCSARARPRSMRSRRSSSTRVRARQRRLGLPAVPRLRGARRRGRQDASGDCSSPASAARLPRRSCSRCRC